MKDRQPCQSVAEARLSVGSAIAAPAITISLKSSLSTARQHRREEPICMCRLLFAIENLAWLRKSLICIRPVGSARGPWP